MFLRGISNRNRLTSSKGQNIFFQHCAHSWNCNGKTRPATKRVYIFLHFTFLPAFSNICHITLDTCFYNFFAINIFTLSVIESSSTESLGIKCVASQPHMIWVARTAVV